MPLTFSHTSLHAATGKWHGHRIASYYFHPRNSRLKIEKRQTYLLLSNSELQQLQSRKFPLRFRAQSRWLRLSRLPTVLPDLRSLRSAYGQFHFHATYFFTVYSLCCNITFSFLIFTILLYHSFFLLRATPHHRLC